MLGTTCIIRSCKNNFLKTRKAGLNISYYRFPVDEQLLIKWKDRCGLKECTIIKSARICSEHFNEEDFNQTGSNFGKRSLKTDAIPSVNLDGKFKDRSKIKSSAKELNRSTRKARAENISDDDDDDDDSDDVDDDENREENSCEKNDKREEHMSEKSENYEEVIKVQIAPMGLDDESNSGESDNSDDNLVRKRKIDQSNSSNSSDGESDLEAFDLTLDTSDDSYVNSFSDDSCDWEPNKVKKRKKNRKKRKLYDESGDNVEYDTNLLSKDGEIEVTNPFNDVPYPDENKDDTSLSITQSLSSLIKEGKILPDKETIAKILDQKILEHSKIINENSIRPLFGRRKRKKKEISQKSVQAEGQCTEGSTKENETNVDKSLENSSTNDNPELPVSSVPSSELNIDRVEELLSSNKDVGENVLINNKQTENSKTDLNVNISHGSDLELSQDSFHDVTIQIPKSKYENFLKKCEELAAEKCQQNIIINNLKEKLKDTESELEAKKEELNLSLLKNEEVNAKLNKMETALAKMLTPNQIKLLLNNSKKVAWTPQEMLSAFTIRFLSRRCYYYLRQKLNYPLPGISSVQRWASLMTKHHGNLNEVQEAVNQLTEGEEGCNESESVMFYPDASSGDVFVEGTMDEINAHSEDSVQKHTTENTCDNNTGRQEHCSVEDNNLQPEYYCDQTNYENHEYREKVIYVKKMQEDPLYRNESEFEDLENGEGYLIQQNEITPEQKSFIKYYDKQEATDGQEDSSLLKALLVGENAENILQSEDQIINSDNQEYVGIIQTQEDNDNGNFSENVIVLETLNLDGVQWQITEEGNFKTEVEGEHYYLAENDEIAEATYFEDQDSSVNSQVPSEEYIKSSNDQRKAIAIYNQEAFGESGKNGEEILHYLYGITEMSPLSVNNTLDHSYAIATLDKYIRTKERHKNRKPPKKLINPAVTTSSS